MSEEENIKQKTLYAISKKAMGTLGSLLDSKKIEIPIKFSDLFEISIGSIVETEIVDQINLVNVLVEEPDILYDFIEFEKGARYNLHDIIGQIICFRLIFLMKQYLDHIQVDYEKETVKENNIEQQSIKN